MVDYVGLVEKGLECPGYQEARGYIEENQTLPSSCRQCYTITIWSAKEEENVEKFSEFFKAEFEAPLKNRGRFKRIYFRLTAGKKKEDFIQEYKERLESQGIETRIDWGRCCGKLKKEFSSLFIGSKKLSEGMQLKMFK